MSTILLSNEDWAAPAAPLDYFTASDSEDNNCTWIQCASRKCTKSGDFHYHKSTHFTCPKQENTLDVWLGRTPPVVTPAKAAACEVTYKAKALGRVKRIHTNWRTNPYKK